jgi:hypothetical protein
MPAPTISSTQRRIAPEPSDREYLVVLVTRVNGMISLPRRVLVVVRAADADAARALAEAERDGFRATSARPALRGEDRARS